MALGEAGCRDGEEIVCAEAAVTFENSLAPPGQLAALV